MKNNNLYKLEYADLLTGMMNKNAYEERLQSFRNNPDSINKFSVAIIDLDSLEHINNIYGQHTVDEAIKITARCIFDTLGEIGMCYHIGSGRFSCVAVGDISGYVSELRDLVSFETANDLSVSVGYVNYNNKFNDIDEVIRYCDKMIQDEKNIG